MSKVLITTVPFADKDSKPLDLLNEMKVEYLINPIGRKLSENELIVLIKDFDILIAGTEPITHRVLEAAPNLKLISRVGIGLDGINIPAARKHGIKITYTPDAPAPAVAELTIGLILNLLRHIHLANDEMHKGQWRRYFGRRISEITFGIIGCGRIGSLVIRFLKNLGASRILINDILLNDCYSFDPVVKFVDKKTIYSHADLISLHLPLTVDTHNLIQAEQLMMMKSDAMIVNTSRGGIINEHDLARLMSDGFLSGAAIDVFENEPYKGVLSNIDRCLLTSHMGSMSVDCRARMEIEATDEVVRYLKGEKLLNEIPRDEYGYEN